MNTSDLLPLVKKNLIIDFDDDDDMLIGMIAGAINYAEGFQNKEDGYYNKNEMSPATQQGITMLASYFYESRDATGGTFFTNNVGLSASNMWRSVNDLLRLNRNWQV